MTHHGQGWIPRRLCIDTPCRVPNRKPRRLCLSRTTGLPRFRASKIRFASAQFDCRFGSAGPAVRRRCTRPRLRNKALRQAVLPWPVPLQRHHARKNPGRRGGRSWPGLKKNLAVDSQRSLKPPKEWRRRSLLFRSAWRDSTRPREGILRSTSAPCVTLADRCHLGRILADQRNPNIGSCNDLAISASGHTRCYCIP